jgi:hypothetical protein
MIACADNRTVIGKAAVLADTYHLAADMAVVILPDDHFLTAGFTHQLPCSQQCTTAGAAVGVEKIK